MNLAEYYAMEPKGSQAYGASRPGRTHTGDDYSHSTRPDYVRVPYVRAGTVVAIQRDPVPWNGYGNQVMVRHSDGSKHSYGHLGRITAVMNQIVTTDMSPGTEGSTGFVFGNCMHLEFWDRLGRRVDPRPSVEAAITGFAGESSRPFPETEIETTEDEENDMWRVITSPAYKAANQRILMRSDVSQAVPVPDGWVQPLVTTGGVKLVSYPTNDELVAEINLFYMMTGLERDEAAKETAKVIRGVLGDTPVATLS